MIVGEKDNGLRCEIIEFLETNGYSLSDGECRTRRKIIDDYLPINVDTDNKVYSMMGNVTCAAAASMNGILLTREEFYRAFV